MWNYDNKIVKDKQIIIGGKTETGTKILLNNHEIDIDENGNFAKEVKLKFGDNCFELLVEDAVNNKSINTINIKYYGNITMYLFGVFGVSYIITISIFVLLYRRKKRINKDLF